MIQRPPKAKAKRKSARRHDAAAQGRKPAAGNDALAELRNRIDGVDERIQRLIAERAHFAKEIGVLKGLTSTAEFYRPEREAQVLRKVVERNDGPLRDEEMVRLFRELMSACLAQEEPLKVAYLGPEGTFTQSAVFKHFGHSVHALAVPTIDEVFHEVESGTADFGVAPIENSSEGTVNIHTLDMFLTSPLKICGEIELRIHQHLMGSMQDLKEVKRICSHPQSLAQCRGWLAQHLPDVEQVAVASNAEAARRARDEEGTAALAGEAAAKVYGLRILFNMVEDRDDNTTRFVVVGRKLFPASGQDKTSVLVSARESSGRPGVLLHLLGPLSKHGVNITRIESRPSRKRKWDYVFFLDLDGHAEDAQVGKALAEMKSKSSLFKVLGSFPKAIL
jgi:chorismate mutase / prephenate dehydratase